MSESDDAGSVKLLEIVEPDSAAVGDALRVLCDGLGEGAYSTDRLRAAVSDPNQLLLGAWIDARLIGALVASQLGAERTWYARFGADAARRVNEAPRLVNLSGAAVLSGFRKRGIGQALIDNALAWARRNGCDTAIAVSWLHPGMGTSRGLLARGGFQSMATASDVYLEDSLYRGLVCNHCSGPCHCRGELFMLGLGRPMPSHARAQG